MPFGTSVESSSLTGGSLSNRSWDCVSLIVSCEFYRCSIYMYARYSHNYYYHLKIHTKVILKKSQLTKTGTVDILMYVCEQLRINVTYDVGKQINNVPETN